MLADDTHAYACADLPMVGVDMLVGRSCWILFFRDICVQLDCPSWTFFLHIKAVKFFQLQTLDYFWSLRKSTHNYSFPVFSCQQIRMFPPKRWLSLIFEDFPINIMHLDQAFVKRYLAVFEEESASAWPSKYKIDNIFQKSNKCTHCKNYFSVMNLPYKIQVYTPNILQKQIKHRGAHMITLIRSRRKNRLFLPCSPFLLSTFSQQLPGPSFPFAKAVVPSQWGINVASHTMILTTLSYLSLTNGAQTSFSNKTIARFGIEKGAWWYLTKKGWLLGAMWRHG